MNKMTFGPPIELPASLAHYSGGDWEFQFLSLEKPPIVIGLTGATKSGKTIIAKRLATEYGFRYLSLGGFLSQIARSMGEMQATTEQLGDIGVILRQLKGKDILAKMAFRDIRRSVYERQARIVLDSLLHPEEIAFFATRTNLVLIGIEAKHDVRIGESRRWFGINRRRAEQMLKRRDRFEQYKQNRDDPFAPNVDGCIALIEDPRRIIHIDHEMTSRRMYGPVDKIMQELSRE